MRISGQLAQLLLELKPGKHRKYISYENNNQIIYVEILKALCGMIMSSSLFHRHFRKNLESVGFKTNLYEICVANQIVGDSQQKVSWHVDDVKILHQLSEVNEEFCQWCKAQYGNDTNGHVKVNNGKVHKYLGMKLDFSKKHKVIVDMESYVQEMVRELRTYLKDNVI